MCGRFAVSSFGEELGSYFDVDELGAYKLAPAWNIKPAQQIPVVLQSARGETEISPAAYRCATSVGDAPLNPGRGRAVRLMIWLTRGSDNRAHSAMVF
jgi:putative SOS response-associated peptidase YedK